MRLDVNTDASIALTAKLEKLHKSAFPSAVRNTLNEVAFISKTLVQKKTDDTFTIRQKNLFKRFTVVEKAKGFNVNQMVSRVGIDGTTNPKLSQGLEKQETGGVISGRRLIAHDKGRVSSSSKKKIKKQNYFSSIGNVGKPNKRIKGSKYIMIKKGVKGTIFEVKNKKLTPIYNIRQTDKTRLQSKPFIKPSAMMASKRLDDIYKKQAEFQFKKYLK